MRLGKSLRGVGRVAAVCACGTVVAVAGCGSSAPKRTTGASAPVARNAVASASPARILSDAAVAVRAAHSYAMRGTLTEGTHAMRIQLLATGPAAFEFTIGQGSTVVEMIELSKHAYIRANAAFLKAHGSALASILAGHWIEVPPAAARQQASALGSLAPDTLARCLVEDHGTLTKVGTTTVNGRPAVLIKDAGNVPGGSPGVLAVATTGATDPLRLTATGPQRPGGHIDVCNDGTAQDVRGTLTFSEFGSVPAIRPPAAVASGGSGTVV